ncbi:hypothetical protein GGR56DRAFT_196853 [Xylariaceae sp. FL0804]|nr:hypothetical protein GGR56DRAFT_196853 [Xylariaceae sp. FL0804]
MWLVHAKTRRLEKFLDGRAPPYAILSHTWGPDDEEISFLELQEADTGRSDTLKPGWVKFDGCCAQAEQDRLDYVWIDTCCIDRANLTELTEAINSMFRYYRNARCCYAYLSDVAVGDDPLEPQSQFRQSRWFQRGWTLQELIAPREVLFYDAHWNVLGTKRDLTPALVAATGIPRPFLLGTTQLYEASVAQRMSWAAGRVTKRTEDRAYCLIGIFDISMTMIYGEGDKAFVRLQEEIAKHIEDDSILAWGFGESNDAAVKPTPRLSGGALATSPSNFSNSGAIVPSHVGGLGRTIQISGGSLLVRRRLHTDSFNRTFVLLNCHPANLPGSVIGVPVEAVTGGFGDYIRTRGHDSTLLDGDIPTTAVKNVRIMTRRSGDLDDSKWLHGFYIDNTLEKHLRLVEVIPNASWGQEKDQDRICSKDVKPTGRLRRFWTKFRHQSGEASDFIVVLDLIWQGAKRVTRQHVMTCRKDTRLDDVKSAFAELRWSDLNKETAHNGVLGLQVTITREPVGRHDMFVVRLLRASEVEETFDVTSDLQRFRIGREIAAKLHQHRRAGLELDSLEQEIRDKRTELQPTQKRLAEIDARIQKLQVEQQSLRGVEHKTLLGLTHLQSQTDAQRRARDDLVATAEKLQRLFDEQQQQYDGRADPVASKVPAPLYIPSLKGDMDDWPETVVHAHLGHLRRLDPTGHAGIDKLPDPALRLLFTAARQGYEAPFARPLALRHLDINLVKVDVGVSWRSLLATAADGGSVRIVAALLALGADPRRRNDSLGWSALRLACRGGSLDVVRLLLDRGDTDIDEVDACGNSLLTHAARRGGGAAVRTLLELGARVAPPQGVQGVSPVLQAVRVDDLAGMRALLDFADGDGEGGDGDTVPTSELRRARKEARSSAVRQLLDERIAARQMREAAMQIMDATRQMREMTMKADEMMEMAMKTKRDRDPTKPHSSAFNKVLSKMRRSRGGSDHAQ